MTTRKIIPIVAQDEQGADSACSEAESFALMVLGDSMEPEFMEGEIIIIEPQGLATDGSFVLARLEEKSGYSASSSVRAQAGGSRP